jgi:hypothetical protein
MKISTILTAVLALTISASAMADGGYRHPGNYVGNVSPRGNIYVGGHQHGGGNALPWLIGGAVLGAIIVNESRDREPQVVYQQPQVVYQQPQVVYQEVARPAPQIVYVPSPYVCPNRNGQFINGVHYCPTYQ